jgi:hypothetical protein
MEREPSQCLEARVRRLEAIHESREAARLRFLAKNRI